MLSGVCSLGNLCELLDLVQSLSPKRKLLKGFTNTCMKLAGRLVGHLKVPKELCLFGDRLAGQSMA